ncbi:iron chelate uptake ABC transporter family permease subunit [Clostridium cibarium]|uniref:Iron chelate uptake ABC transporter family permease subunit n=1 Tax=Clostridium cibarium TaxID=2762247 RepID=A0ABR8PSS2_9CLOT|nr:iron chelate uptake ABC transporter family permease subunit [Clostridium cibarium]
MKIRYLVISLIILSIISIFIGSKDIKIIDLLSFEKDKLEILILSRIPRLISILAAGTSIAVSGLIMQQISRNSFVSPTTGATEDSAKFGILVSIILFPSAGYFSKMIICFIFSLAGTFLFMYILRKIKFKNDIFVPLIGIMLGAIIESINTFFAYKFDVIQNIESWAQGNFSMIIKDRYELVYLSIPLMIIAYLFANKFTISGMGKEFSKNLGLDYNKVVNIGVVIVALISSIMIIIVGKIPFLGLIIPNIIRIYNGDNLKENFVSTSLFGAVFLLFCDILGRLIIYPYEIPIGLMVVVIGSGVFLYLLFRRKLT